MNTNEDTKREAPESMNGFFYQRYCCVNEILKKNNFSYEYVLEEGYEDIDFINCNKNRKIIQIKYYGDKNESLTYNSGLYKVIISNYDKKDIDNIDYYAYNKNKDIFKKSLYDAFKNNKYSNIGKYIILLIYKNRLKKKENIPEFDIKNIENIETEFYKNIKKIKQNFEKDNDDKYKKIFNFFKDKNRCNTYFKKFKLCEGKSFKDLNSEIDSNIVNCFGEFVNTNNEENTNLRVLLIKNTIFNILTEKMFENIKSTDRKIKYDTIFNKINENIQTFRKIENLYHELLKQTENIIVNSFEHKQIEQLNVVKYINQIKNINIDSLDNVSFLICLLNNHYDKLEDSDIDDIKNYLFIFVSRKYNYMDNSIYKNKKIIRYLNMITNQSKNKNRYKIPNEKLIKLMDENFSVKEYFKSVKK